MTLQEIATNELAADELQQKTGEEIARIEMLLSRLESTYKRYGIKVFIGLDAKHHEGKLLRAVRATDGDEELLSVFSSTYEDAIKSCQMHATVRAANLESLDQCLNPDEAPCGDCIWCDTWPEI